MKLYYHKTDGGAEYLMNTYVNCETKEHKKWREGAINSKTKYIVRIDGDITKDAELIIRETKKENEKYIDALNLLNELAEQGGQYGEEKKAQQKAYNLLFNFITKI